MPSPPSARGAALLNGRLDLRLARLRWPVGLTYAGARSEMRTRELGSRLLLYPKHTLPTAPRCCSSPPGSRSTTASSSRYRSYPPSSAARSSTWAECSWTTTSCCASTRPFRSIPSCSMRSRTAARRAQERARVQRTQTSSPVADGAAAGSSFAQRLNHPRYSVVGLGSAYQRRLRQSQRPARAPTDEHQMTARGTSLARRIGLFHVNTHCGCSLSNQIDPGDR
jgi:hypothetical protein